MKSTLRQSVFFTTAISITLFLLWAGGTGSLAQTQPQKPDDKFVMVPGVRVGDITATTTFADLVRIYGKANVTSEEISGNEGDSYPGAKVFPKDPQKTLEIIWKDPDHKRNPELVRIAGETTSVWKTDTGITLGTTLKEVEKINGKPFKISGFEWDLGGLVVDWNGGKLTAQTLGMGFQPREGVTEKEAQSVNGDRVFPSTNRVLQKMNPKVSYLECRF